MLRLLAIVALTCASLQAQAEGVVEILNRLRAPGGACAVNAAPLVPLVAKWALDEAAANVARGRSLAAALQSADYRAKEVQEIKVAGARDGARLEGFLAARFCAPLAMAQLTEAGIYAAGETVWILIAEPIAPAVELSREQVAERTLALVNRARGQERHCGERLFPPAKPVKWSELLEQASQRHAADMAANSHFSHAGLDGSTSAQRVTRAGYRYRAMGENIAAGQRTPEDAVSSWIASPTHCANLMNAAFTEMGVAYVVNPASAMGIYWTQTFGKPL